MNTVEIIIHKRNGGVLPQGAIGRMVQGFVDGTVPDYQMSAFLMAAFLNELSETETAELVHAMLHSGEVLDLSRLPGAKIDKHSTGGVGDKVSIVLAPLVAACGVTVPMISGRGLGHTGGTLDKLESIPGFRTDLDLARFRRQLADLGTCMIGQTTEIAPADRALYALRDVTGTVESIPLIAASIMSKKLAEGLDGLVLDVKCGAGAFMQTESEARRLAETLVGVGEANGCRTVALLTAMDSPLGLAAGNWCEIVESVDCLRGGGPADLRELTLALAGEMIALAGLTSDPAVGAGMASKALDDGSALDRFLRMVEAQGGDPRSLEDPAERDGYSPGIEVTAATEGRLQSIHAREIGATCVDLGAGRLRKEDDVDPLAGIVLNKKPGDNVGCGETLAWIHASDTDRAARLTTRVRAAFTIGDAPVKTGIVLDRYADGAWTHPAR